MKYTSSEQSLDCQPSRSKWDDVGFFNVANGIGHHKNRLEIVVFIL